MSLSRRTVLKYGLGGALVLAAGGVGIGLQAGDGGGRTPARPLRALDPRSFAILAAVADRMAPGGGAFPSAAAVEVPEKIDALLARGDPEVAAELRQVLRLLDNALAGLLFDARPRAFTALSPEAQDEALRAWRGSRFELRRTAYKALHGLCMAAYYASPEVWPAVGYPGPPDYGQRSAP